MFIGCSGYYYLYWKGRFYPAEVPAKDWLAYYATVFNTVELNGTFYRTPQLGALQRYASATPEYFRFSVKMPKLVTHIQRLGESKESIAQFQDLVLQGLAAKVLHFLFQLPPSFHFSTENLSRVLENVPHGAQQVVEFRHASWWNEEVIDALSKAGVTFCNVDFPGLEVPFVQTNDHFYLRLHGNPVLFKSPYSEGELKAFYHRIPGAAVQQSVYFNNTWYEAGYENALLLQGLNRAEKG